MRRHSLTELDAVLAVSRRGSFRAAARELGLSTSAVSAAVAALEARLAVRLFHRTTRSVALTEAGRHYVERIGPAVKAIHEAGEHVHGSPGEPSGTLRISAPPETTVMVMPIIEAFLAQYPQMRLEIVTNARMIDIVADGFDAGIRLAESVPQDMVAVPLGPDLRQVVVATPQYLQRHGTPVAPDQLAHHPAIRWQLSGGGLYRWALERRGQAFQADPPSRLVVSDMRAGIAAACAGVGLAFLSEWHIRQELEAGTLVRVLEDWCPPFPGLRLYYPGHRHVPVRLQALVRTIQSTRAVAASA